MNFVNFKQSAIDAYNKKQANELERKSKDEAQQIQNGIASRIQTVKAFYARLNGDKFSKWSESTPIDGVVVTCYEKPLKDFPAYCVVAEYSGVKIAVYSANYDSERIAIQVAECKTCGSAVFQHLRRDAINTTPNNFLELIGELFTKHPELCAVCLSQKEAQARLDELARKRELDKQRVESQPEPTLAERLESLIREIAYECAQEATR
jgi:phage-related protein